MRFIGIYVKCATLTLRLWKELESTWRKKKISSKSHHHALLITMTNKKKLTKQRRHLLQRYESTVRSLFHTLNVQKVIIKQTVCVCIGFERKIYIKSKCVSDNVRDDLDLCWPNEISNANRQQQQQQKKKWKATPFASITIRLDSIYIFILKWWTP